MIECLKFPHFIYTSDGNGKVIDVYTLVFASMLLFDNTKLLDYLIDRVIEGKVVINIHEAMIIHECK